MVIWVIKNFLYSFVYSCHLFPISSDSLRSKSFLSFIVKCPSLYEFSLGISNFPEEISSVSHSVVSSISLHCSHKKAFFPLLYLLWNSTSRCVYLSFSPLPFTSLLFIAVGKAYSDKHFALSHLFFLGMVLVTASCTMLQTSVCSSLGILIYQV